MSPGLLENRAAETAQDARNEAPEWYGTSSVRLLKEVMLEFSHPVRTVHFS